MFFRKKPIPQKEKEDTIKTYLALDIGTEYVKSVVYTLDKTEVVILGYNRMRQKESSMYAAYIVNLEEAQDTIDKSVGEAVQMAQSVYGKLISLPKEVIVGIAGELVQGVTIVVNLERSNPQKEINQQEITDIINKIKLNTFSNTKEEISKEMGLKSHQIDEVATYINSVFIDGIRVLNPLKYKGSEMLYRVYSTFAPKVHVSSIEQVAKALNLTLKKVVVEPYALSMGLKNLRANNAGGIIIDIGGGTTDIALVQKGDIVGTKMFAFGGRVFTKRIMKSLNIKSFLEADEKKIEYSNGSLPKIFSSVVSKELEKDVQVWMKGVEIALEEMDDVSEYPPNIFLCGGGALLPEIQEVLISYPWLKNFNFKKFPKVEFVFPNHIGNIVDKTREAKLPSDVTPLSLARMHLET